MSIAFHGVRVISYTKSHVIIFPSQLLSLQFGGHQSQIVRTKVLDSKDSSNMLGLSYYESSSEDEAVPDVSQLASPLQPDRRQEKESRSMTLIDSNIC